jgi:glycosyltransferase involved in cell wall biosynthesis
MAHEVDDARRAARSAVSENHCRRLPWAGRLPASETDGDGGADSIGCVKISFLLPTRDRLDYLKLAIETVRQQSSADWEVVISDNDSTEDVSGYVRSLDDARIHVERTAELLPVTENWNAALAMSSGDYVLMLGDDDGVLPSYVAEMTALIDRFEEPDMIYTGSLLFTYPGVDPSAPGGFLASNTYAEFFGDSGETSLLTRQQAMAAVRKSLALKLAFNFNMQLSLLSRRLIDDLRTHGEVFQSPFPDYYASCAALLRARRVVADPRELVVIGVTPKSYGFFHVNDRESEGRAFLGGTVDAPPQLPGTNINEGWMKAMESLEANYGAEYGLRAGRRRYRLLQAQYVYTRRFRGTGSPAEVALLEASLPAGERLILRAAYAVARIVIRLVPRPLWRAVNERAMRQFPDDLERPRDEGGYRNLLEVTRRLGAEGREATAG